MRRIALLLDRQSLTVMMVIGLAAMCSLAAAAIFSGPATANTSTRAADEAIAQMDHQQRSAPRMSANADGGLLLKPVTGGVATEVPAVRLGTDIVADVSGQTTRVTVTQAFRNTSDTWMEATYLYPLPDDGAVDTLKMVVGDRIFDGKIKPREEAREMYEEALANGQKAGLVEQERPNMFRNSIANVGPGETVLVQIEFQAPIRQVAGDYSLRMPLVVGPRYIAMRGGGGSSLSRAASLAGSSDILAPTADPNMVARAGSGLNPVSITVNLDPGFTAKDIANPYHAVDIAGSGERRTITLADGAVPADKDFELRWSAAGDAPALGLYKQTNGALDYVMATITPPSFESNREAPPREMIFVIDNSGSMAGESMPAARRSLLYALETLRPQDRFNIIRFDDTMTELFASAVQANRSNLEQAKTFTHSLEAEGGTEMLPALRAALRDDEVEGRVRQVIFMTDGGLSNEADMMREIGQNRGRSRVFMVGIGSAPNSFLMRRMAEAGRGTFTHIGIGDEAEPQMRRLLDRLAKPVATNLTARVAGGNIDFAPRNLPDLYAGEPLVLLGRTRHLAGTLTVSGMIDGRRWTRTRDLTAATDSDVVAKLWAKRRIEEVEAERWSGEISYERADESIEELGMDFHLVTSRTSLVAIDETPSRLDGMGLTREELPLLLPAGWDFEHLFGGHTASAADWDALADAMADEEERRERLQLPQGSTNYFATLAMGLALLLSGIAGGLWWRRERFSQAPTLPDLQRQAA